MDETNIDVTPRSFQENVWSYNWILEDTLKSASYDDLVKLLHLFKNPDGTIYDGTAGKIAAELTKHVMNNELIRLR